MPWRVIAFENDVWHVDAVAERRPNARSWQLTLAFRSGRAAAGRDPVWASYPLEAASKSALYIQAERISDRALTSVLAECLR